MILPQEGGSDDKIDVCTVLPSNPPLSGKALLYQQYLVSKQKQEEEKKEKKKQKKKDKKQNKKKIEKNFFLPQKTGLENNHLESTPNVSTMMFHHVFAPLLSK